MKKTAIYPGTFDPITNGHLSIVKRALQIFDKLIIAILNNPNKSPFFSIDERVQMIGKSLEGVRQSEHVEIDTFEGLLVNYAVNKETNVILRGLRAFSDFEYEFQMALMNRKLNRDIQSIFLMTDYKWFYTSSSIVKETAGLGGDVQDLVPQFVLKKLKERFQQNK